MNEIIIKEFNDRRWMRSEVFQELMKIAAEECDCKECGSSNECDNCSSCKGEEELLAFDQIGFAGDPMNDNMMEDNSTEMEKEKSLSEQFAKDKESFEGVIKRMSNKAEELIEEGKISEAFIVERKVRQIKYNLKEMEKLAKLESNK